MIAKKVYYVYVKSKCFDFDEKQTILKVSKASDIWVFFVFLDATKAFDRVSHYKLFKKLIVRYVPTCFVRLLRYWYAHQTMQVKWDNCLPDSYLATNGVRQGGVLSPYLFAIYIDDLSVELNKLQAGCCIGSNLIDHILQYLLTICVAFLLALKVCNLLLTYVLNLLWRMI